VNNETLILGILVTALVILIIKILLLRKKIEKFEKKFEEFTFVKSAFEALPTPIYYKNATGKIIYCNKQFYKDFGHTNKKTIEVLENYHGVNQVETQLIFDNNISKNILFIQNNFLDDKKNLLGSVGFILDTDKQTKERHSIIEKRNLLQYAFENAQEGYFEWDVQKDKAHYSSKWKEIMGYTAQDDEPNNLAAWMNLVESLDISKVNEAIRKHLDGNTTFLNIEHRIRTFSPSKWVNIRAKALRDSQNKPSKLIGTITDITSTKLKEKELESQKNLFTSFMDVIPLLSFIKDKSGKYLYLNHFHHHYIEYKEWKNKTAKDLFASDIAEKIIEADREAFYEAISEHQEILIDPKGKQRIFQTYKTPMKQENEELLLGIGIDITAQVAAKEKLYLYKQILDATKNSIVILSPKKKIVSVNKVFEQISGFHEIDILEKDISLRYSQKHEKDLYEKVWQEVLKQGVWRGKIYFKNQDGTDFLEIVNIYAVHSKVGIVQNYFIISQGIQREKFIEKSLSTSLDSLTKLPNKAAFFQLLEKSIIKASQNQENFALIYINIDDFRIINDSFGQKAGDLALKEIATKLSYHIRQNDILAKLDNDEFILLLDNITSNADVNIVSQRIIQELMKPTNFGDNKEILSASIGISLYPIHAVEAKKLFDFAHLAMYKSKREGKNMFTLYKP
jgi:diguanylate cyclase (GGDEF)-like protein/PAS domain S-box-containing protein